jgi:hypothetical protein
METAKDRAGRVFPFKRGLLPRPARYFREQGVQFTGGLEWKTARCPFHPDDRKSLLLCLDSGAFKCERCAAKGRDVLSFHQLLHGLTFKQAAQDLGAWADE